MSRPPKDVRWLLQRSGPLLLAILAILLYAGLHPFNFLARNAVVWLLGEHGVRYDGYGQVVGDTPIDLWPSGAISAPNDPAITVELWTSSFQEPKDGIFDVLSIHNSSDAEDFAIEQWKGDLVIGGYFHDNSGPAVFRHRGIEGGFTGPQRRFVTLTSGADGTAIYLNGVQRARYPSLQLARKNFEGIVLLGQTPQAHQEWSGEILGLAILPVAVTPAQVQERCAAWLRQDFVGVAQSSPGGLLYPFTEGRGAIVHDQSRSRPPLTMPTQLRAIEPVILGAPTARDFRNTSDVALNILGFIPFGFVLMAWFQARWRWRGVAALVTAILIGAAVSLTIELLQVYLPSRDSSLLDLINNIVGTAFGALLGWIALRRLRFVTG